MSRIYGEREKDRTINSKKNDEPFLIVVYQRGNNSANK